MDNYDVLMNLKRQATTGTNSTPAEPTSRTSAPSTPAPTTPASTPTPTSTPPPTTRPSSTPPPPTSTSSPSSTPLTTSTPTSTPVSTSLSSVSSTPLTTSTPTSSSTRLTTSVPATTPTSLIGISSGTPRSTLSVGSSGFTVVRTTSNGQILTATLIIGQPSGSAAPASAKKPFFQNTGAVVGVFVVVGVVATALAVFIITLFIRRRRAKKFDRDVQEAAREAALAQAPVDDDDYANSSYNTHASKPMNTERPGYGSTAASSWDPYGRAGGAAAGGYEMQHRRTSTGTAPGMAGFGAGETFARNVGIDAPQGYNQPQGYGPGYGGYNQQQGYNQPGYNQQQGYNQGYNNQQGYQTQNNTSPPQTYALAQERDPTRAAPRAQMMMPEAQRQGYNTVDAYRAGPSYGQAHPGEQAEYGHAGQGQGGYGYAYSGEDEARGRPSEDPYGGYEGHNYSQAGGSHAEHGSTSGTALPAYAPGPAGNAGATGDRKGGASGSGSGSGSGAALVREPSGKSAATRYSQDDSDGSVYERQERRVLKVANE